MTQSGSDSGIQAVGEVPLGTHFCQFYRTKEDLARKLRLDPENEGLLLIAVTGYGNREDMERAQLSGFDYHLVKPIDLQSLRTLLVSRRFSEPM
jgi:hypothetical protein